MKVKVDRRELSKILAISSSIVEKRNTMPILKQVRIEMPGGSGGFLKISASNLETSLRANLEVLSEARTEKSDPFDIDLAVDAKVFSDIVKELSEDELRIEFFEDYRLLLKSGGSLFKIAGIPGDEFPRLPEPPKGSVRSIDAKQMSYLLSKTIFAASNDESRYSITGVNLSTENIDGDSRLALRFVASDGYRVAIARHMCDCDEHSFADDGEPFFSQSSFTVPKRAAVELKKFLDSVDGDVDCCASDDCLAVQKDGISLSINCISTPYPNYSAMITEDFISDFEVEKGDLLSAIRRASIVSDMDKYLELRLEGGNLDILCKNEMGEAVESVSVNQSGEDFLIGFNARMLVEVVSSMAMSDIISVLFGGDDVACVFRGDGDSDGACYLMPLRL